MELCLSFVLFGLSNRFQISFKHFTTQTYFCKMLNAQNASANEVFFGQFETKQVKKLPHAQGKKL